MWIAEIIDHRYPSGVLVEEGAVHTLTPAVTGAFVVSAANEESVRVYGLVMPFLLHKGGLFVELENPHSWQL